jgi:ribulose-5-phosphate 4-epimerase/fuculose-1-phosphate aldolase
VLERRHPRHRHRADAQVVTRISNSDSLRSVGPLWVDTAQSSRYATDMSAVTTEEELRIDLAAAFHLAVHHDLHESIANHFSVLLPDDNHFLVNPYGLHFSEVTASNLVVCDMDGHVVRGNGAPAASAKHIHAPIHRLLPQARVILHTHQPHATALTMVQGGRIEMALQAAVRFYGRDVYDTEYDGVALSDSVGERMAKMIGDNEIVFLGNHGVITVGPTVGRAYDDLYFLEKVAKTQILAQSTGLPLAIMSNELLEQTCRQSEYERLDLGYAENHFAALKRLLDRDPNTAKYRS